MNPIKIETWQCPICETEYETEQEAIKCLSQPEITPNYSEGDIVYLIERYPDSPQKPFVKRKITKVRGIVPEDREHKFEYKLNEMVEVGDGFYVGRVSACYDDSYRFAHEDDFLKLGEPYYWDESIVVSPETVENYEEII